jgi:hypothetical protein
MFYCFHIKNVEYIKTQRDSVESMEHCKIIHYSNRALHLEGSVYIIQGHRNRSPSNPYPKTPHANALK